jgi:hypothetical protein
MQAPKQQQQQQQQALAWEKDGKKTWTWTPCRLSCCRFFATRRACCVP